MSSGPLNSYQTEIEKYIDFQHEERGRTLDALKEYGSSTIRMAFLLNGGSIIALLTLIGVMFGGESTHKATAAAMLAQGLKLPFILYGSGVLAAAFSSGVAYLNWSLVGEAYLSPTEIYGYLTGKPPKKSPWLYWTATATLWIAIVLALISLCLFGVGSWMVVDKLAAIRI
jgi:hypothetical protein